jgi:hypothetical protein
MIPETDRRPANWQPKPRKRYIVEANDCRLTVDGSGGFLVQDGLLRFTDTDGRLTAFCVANVSYFQEAK